MWRKQRSSWNSSVGWARHCHFARPQAAQCFRFVTFSGGNLRKIIVSCDVKRSGDGHNALPKIRAAVKCLADCRNLALPFGWMHLFFQPISHSFTCLFVLYSPAYSFFFFVLSFFSFFSFSFFYLLIGLIFCFSFSKKYMYMIIVYVVVYIPV